MYSHCLFCRSGLGTNDVIESLPIGRRVAFDAAKGRLWVVCPRCRQWNLTPFEERWEAVETAERLYRDTRRRVQGDQVGLARLKEGLELVRIGKPQRPEFAAWRYGDRFGRRRKEMMVRSAIAAGAVGAAVVAGPLIGVSVGAAVMAGSTLTNILAAAYSVKANIKLPHPEGGDMLITPNDRPHVRLVERAAENGGWGLDVPYQRIVHAGDPWWKRDFALNMPGGAVARLSGHEALRAAEQLLPRANVLGARSGLVQEAVTLIEDAGGSEQWFTTAAAQTRKWGAQQSWGDTGAINFLPKPVRLALEMAAHEEAERRALEGELAELETRWREAEEVAAIADDMFLPQSVTQFIALLKSSKA